MPPQSPMPHQKFVFKGNVELALQSSQCFDEVGAIRGWKAESATKRTAAVCPTCTSCSRLQTAV